jgi:hypothetical protein
MAVTTASQKGATKQFSLSGPGSPEKFEFSVDGAGVRERCRQVLGGGG